MLIVLRKKIRAQSTAEYAIFFGIIIAVAIGMQKYLKRGMQGKVKSVTDAVSKSATGQEIAGTGVSLEDEGQYVPYYLVDEETSSTSRSQDADKTTTISEGGAFTRTSSEDIKADATQTEDYSGTSTP
ncbi:MAG: hypothetical protein K9L80_01560 [Candidatus Omnitrophica bacterium]|nr:hypothetical protein [Candidatus Omnitrophota bacterium]MCF7887492.1 hypothetical protein [Candidatus Omnitrophota bacterium]MCF7888045.1 hypothetical protein [Candidatus Omnitrophota bacterium]